MKKPAALLVLALLLPQVGSIARIGETFSSMESRLGEPITSSGNIQAWHLQLRDRTDEGRRQTNDYALIVSFNDNGISVREHLKIAGDRKIPSSRLQQFMDSHLENPETLKRLERSSSAENGELSYAIGKSYNWGYTPYYSVSEGIFILVAQNQTDALAYDFHTEELERMLEESLGNR